MLRIAFINHSHELGGAEHLLLTLIDGLPRERYEPLIIVPRAGLLADEARKRNIPVAISPLPPFWSLSVLIGSRKILNPVAVCWTAYLMAYAAWRLQRIIYRCEIDIVQTNSVFAHVYGGLAARIARRPCIWYFHDLIEPHRLKGTIARTWRALATLLATQIVAVSHAALQALAAEERGVVIYAGCTPGDASNFREGLRAKTTVPENSKLVVFIGRVAYSKGLDVLAHAASCLVKRDPMVHFVILGDVGESDTQYKQYVLSLLSQLDVVDHWHWVGYVEQASDLICDAALLVLPSRREALPLVLIEAGLAQKAVVASRVGGTPEVVVDGDTGLLVPPEDPDALADAILRLVENDELAAKMGQKARLHLLEVFDRDRYFTEFQAVYDHLQGM